MWKDSTDDIQSPEEVRVENSGNLCIGVFFDGAYVPDSCVVDQHIDSAEVHESELDRGLHICKFCYIDADGLEPITGSLLEVLNMVNLTRSDYTLPADFDEQLR